MFSCEVCEIFKNTFFNITPLLATFEPKHIHASAADLLHIRIGNLDRCKCGHCKNEAREIDCACCRKVDAMLIVWLKSRGAREAFRHAVTRIFFYKKPVYKKLEAGAP